MTTTWNINRLSREWVGPITVAADGTPVTGWTYALLPEGQAPASPEAISGVPSNLDGGLGVLVGPGTDHVLDPGVHVLWVRYVADTEAPVLANVGRVNVYRGATP